MAVLLITIGFNTKRVCRLFTISCGLKAHLIEASERVSSELIARAQPFIISGRLRAQMIIIPICEAVTLQVCDPLSKLSRTKDSQGAVSETCVRPLQAPFDIAIAEGVSEVVQFLPS